MNVMQTPAAFLKPEELIGFGLKPPDEGLPRCLEHRDVIVLTCSTMVTLFAMTQTSFAQCADYVLTKTIIRKK